MEFIMWIIFGAIAGWIASMIMEGDPERGPIFDILIGVIGALVGGFVMNVLGSPSISGFNLYSLTVALLGSVILLAVVKALKA